VFLGQGDAHWLRSPIFAIVSPMVDTFADLEQRARHLPAEERARLALAMIESLDTVDEGDVDEAWRVEAEARGVQIDRGEVETTPAADVFAEVRRSLK
jgi:hypothetical protein